MEKISFRSPKEFLDAWRRILAYGRRYIPLLCLASALAVGCTVLTLLAPAVLSDLTNLLADSITGDLDIGYAAALVLTLFLLYTGSFLFSVIEGWLFISVTHNITRHMRADIIRKIGRVPVAYFNSTSAGIVLSRIANAVDTCGQAMQQSIGNFLSAATMILGAVILMVRTDLTMALVSMGASLVGFVPLLLLVGASQTYFTQHQKNIGILNGHVEESYTGRETLRAYGALPEAMAKFDRLNKILRDSIFRSQCMAAFMPPIMMFTSNLGYVAVCVAGTVEALRGETDIGTIVTFMLYIRYFTDQLSKIGQALQSLQLSGAAGARALDFLDEEEMPADTGTVHALPAARGHIRFENVSFRYDGSEKEILHGFSAEVLPGQTLAVVGDAGSGKTTLVHLLLRFFEPTAGRILVDGIPLHQMDREAVHSLFCLIPADPWIFRGTVRENLLFNKTNVSEERMREAADAVGLHSFVRQLPEEYDTVLDDSISLSRGQMQEIAIVRAVLDDATILLLDEAFSALDSYSEARVREALSSILQGKTTVMVTHSPSALSEADRVIVLRGGAVAAEGTHESLVQSDERYAASYGTAVD